jgi:ribosomal-protein-alanine N-acetyltransferase
MAVGLAQQVPIQVASISSSWLPRLVEIDSLWNPRAWSLNLFERELINPAARVKGIFVAEELVGYLIAHVVCDEAHIVSLGIEQHWRNRGLGRMLLDGFLRAALVENVTAVTLEVRASNITAQKLYHSAGFVVAGIRRHYYSDNSEDGLTMRWSAPGART